MSANKYGLDLRVGDLWYTPFWKTPFFWVFTGLILLLTLAIICWKWRSKPKILTAEDHIMAVISSLKRLDSKIDSINIQKFYLDLITKCKKIIKYRYDIDVVGSTDEEAKIILGQSQVDGPIKMVFVEVLESSYTVRFAKGAVARAKMAADLQKVLTTFGQSSYTSK